MYRSLALHLSRWSFPEPYEAEMTLPVAQPRGRGINCHPGGVEELSQMSDYYAAMRGS